MGQPMTLTPAKLLLILSLSATLYLHKWELKAMNWMKNLFNPLSLISNPEEATAYSKQDYQDRTENYYLSLWNTMVIDQEILKPLNYTIGYMERNKARYQDAEVYCDVDWRILATLHMMESSGDFSKQLINGEIWSNHTTRVPKGLGPWPSWESSCVEAMEMFDFKNQPLIETLINIEKYNGLGYIKAGIHSPYLWSGSQHYITGKYVADGVYKHTAVSKQIGAAIILKLLGYGEDYEN